MSASFFSLKLPPLPSALCHPEVLSFSRPPSWGPQLCPQVLLPPPPTVPYTLPQTRPPLLSLCSSAGPGSVLCRPHKVPNTPAMAAALPHPPTAVRVLVLKHRPHPSSSKHCAPGDPPCPSTFKSSHFDQALCLPASGYPNQPEDSWPSASSVLDPTWFASRFSQRLPPPYSFPLIHLPPGSVSGFVFCVFKTPGTSFACREAER